MEDQALVRRSVGRSLNLTPALGAGGHDPTSTYIARLRRLEQQPVPARYCTISEILHGRFALSSTRGHILHMRRLRSRQYRMCNTPRQRPSCACTGCPTGRPGLHLPLSRRARRPSGTCARAAVDALSNISSTCCGCPYMACSGDAARCTSRNRLRGHPRHTRDISKGGRLY